jgi:hypothetical protein
VLYSVGGEQEIIYVRKKKKKKKTEYGECLHFLDVEGVILKVFEPSGQSPATRHERNFSCINDVAVLLMGRPHMYDSSDLWSEPTDQ